MVAAGGSAARTPQAADSEGLVEPIWTPLGLRNDTTTVDGSGRRRAVGSRRGQREPRAQRRREGLDRGQAQGARRQASSRPIEKLGGTVVADYQAAYNGIKVRIDRAARPTRSRRLANVVAVRPLQVMRLDNTKGVPLIGAPAVWGGVARPSRRGHQDRRHRHRHRLHARQLRRSRHGRRVRRRATPRTRCRRTRRCSGRPRRASRAASTSSATTTTPTRTPRTYQPDAASGPEPARLQRARLARRRLGRRLRRARERHDVRGPVQRDHDLGQLAGRSARASRPKADIYGIRVFGCDGSTDVTVDAIEWAVENDMDVINMSLGSRVRHRSDDPSAVASTNAAKAGVIVVTSAGNSGPNQYITGSPGTADGAIATAANDPSHDFPGADDHAVRTASTIDAHQRQRAHVQPGRSRARSSSSRTTRPPTPAEPESRSADESLGCRRTHAFNDVAGKIAVVKRGACARVAQGDLRPAGRSRSP